MEQNVLKQAKKQFSTISFALIVGVVVLMLAQALFGELVKLLAKNVEFFANPSVSFVVMMLSGYVTAFPLMFFLLGRMSKKEEFILAKGEPKKMGMGQLIVAAIMCYGLTIAVNMVGNIITSLVGIVKQSSVDNVMVDLVSSINSASIFFIMVIAAPILEELLFRKYIMDRCLCYGERVAIGFSALLFGLFHGNFNQFIYALAIGCLLGFIYAKTRNIKYTIAIHMFINFMGGFMGKLVIEKSGLLELMNVSQESSPDAVLELLTKNALGMLLYFVYALFVMGFAITGIILLIVKRKKFQFEEAKVLLDKATVFKAVFLNLGTILFCVFWIVLIILQLIK